MTYSSPRLVHRASVKPLDHPCRGIAIGLPIAVRAMNFAGNQINTRDLRTIAMMIGPGRSAEPNREIDLIACGRRQRLTDACSTAARSRFEIEAGDEVAGHDEDSPRAQAVEDVVVILARQHIGLVKLTGPEIRSGLSCLRCNARANPSVATIQNRRPSPSKSPRGRRQSPSCDRSRPSCPHRRRRNRRGSREACRRRCASADPFAASPPAWWPGAPSMPRYTSGAASLFCRNSHGSS